MSSSVIFLYPYLSFFISVITCTSFYHACSTFFNMKRYNFLNFSIFSRVYIFHVQRKAPIGAYTMKKAPRLMESPNIKNRDTTLLKVSLRLLSNKSDSSSNLLSYSEILLCSQQPRSYATTKQLIRVTFSPQGLFPCAFSPILSNAEKLHKSAVNLRISTYFFLCKKLPFDCFFFLSRINLLCNLPSEKYGELETKDFYYLALCLVPSSNYLYLR